jgi:hypothetical protein
MSGQHPANAVDVHIQEESTNHNHGSEWVLVSQKYFIS